jgi:hypothetical protein
MAQEFIQVLRGTRDLLSADIGTLPQALIAGMRVLRASRHSNAQGILTALVQSAESTQGAERQVTLTQFWTAVRLKAQKTNRRAAYIAEISEAIMSSVSVHDAAFEFASSCEWSLLVKELNATVEYLTLARSANKSRAEDDLLIPIGYFCSMHRPHIKSHNLLFEAPPALLKTLCGFAEQRHNYVEVLQAVGELCEFALSSRETGLLQAVIYRTLSQTLVEHIDTHIGLKQRAKASLDKYRGLFTEAQMTHLLQICDGCPKPVERPAYIEEPKRKSRNPAHHLPLVDVERVVVELFKAIHTKKGMSLELIVERLVKTSQDDKQARVLLTLKQIAKKLDFTDTGNQSSFNELLLFLQDTELIDDFHAIELQLQFYPQEKPLPKVKAPRAQPTSEVPATELLKAFTDDLKTSHQEVTSVVQEEFKTSRKRPLKKPKAKPS